MGWDSNTLKPELRKKIAEKQGLIAPEGTQIYTFLNKHAYGEELKEQTDDFKGPEKQLQRDCEEWLKHRGYWPRDYKHLDAGRPPCGWYIHIHNAPGNPILLDILILREDGRYLELELKRNTGKLSKHQKAIVEQGGYVVRSIEEFIAAITDWEERAFNAN